jgi:hypothetical protein
MFTNILEETKCVQVFPGVCLMSADGWLLVVGMTFDGDHMLCSYVSPTFFGSPLTDVAFKQINIGVDDMLDCIWVGMLTVDDP